MFRKIRTFTWILALAVSAGAQQDRSAIIGIVKDSSESIIRGAKVIVTQVETGATYATISNDMGQFTVPDLPVGKYRLSFEAPAFKRLVRDGVHVKLPPPFARSKIRLFSSLISTCSLATSSRSRLPTAFTSQSCRG
jgi:hypothetical protein